MKDLEILKEQKRRFMRRLNAEQSEAMQLVYANAVNYVDKQIGANLRTQRVLKILFPCLLLVFCLVGCSGGVSVSAGVGGSFHPQAKSKDLAPIVRETPIIKTSTDRSFSLPMIRGNN